jgi:pimeloyl-ACP methyl ester carboxylesterase
MNKSQFQPFLNVSLLMVLILSACAPSFMPVPTPTPTGPRFELAGCMFGDVNGVDCGYLYVPEDRSRPGGAQIPLAVAIIRSTNPNPAPDPVLFLVSWLGGPGSHYVEFTTGLMIVLKEVRANRDVIVFDQRGAGYSLPSLECPEVESQVLRDAPQNLSQEELQRHGFQAYRACHDRLEEEGIDLSTYTNAANAADVNDLRVALGYTEWNIVGDSYGAHLALTIMRDFPEGVRSVVLDSVYPPQANSDIEAAVNAERALKLLFERCASDEACNTAYPNLETVFYDAAAQLDTDPISFDLDSQQTREKVTVLINGDRMINLIVHLLQFTDVLQYIPKWIYEFYEGDANSDFMLKGFMYYFVFTHEVSSEGKGLSLQCDEEISFSSAQSIESANAVVSPRLQETVNQGRYLAMCPAWDVEPAAEIEIQPVVSDIPTLLLTGDNDPGSPPAWSIAIAENLSNSHYFEFPWASHGLSYGVSPASLCARSITSAFIANPTTTPDSACIDKLTVTFITR